MKWIVARNKVSQFGHSRNQCKGPSLWTWEESTSSEKISVTHLRCDLWPSDVSGVPPRYNSSWTFGTSVFAELWESGGILGFEVWASNQSHHSHKIDQIPVCSRHTWLTARLFSGVSLPQGFSGHVRSWTEFFLPRNRVSHRSYRHLGKPICPLKCQRFKNHVSCCFEK